MSAPAQAQTLAEKRAALKAAQSRKTTAAVAPATTTALESIFKDLRRDGRHTLRFQLTPTHVSYANTLRRTMITEVETVGFRADILSNGSTSDVQILQNSTPMSNEMLAHRIGLLPIHIKTPLEWKPDDYIFKLDVTNNSATPLDVVASDIQVLKNRGPEEDPLPVPSVEFFHPNPITHDTSLLAVLKGKVGAQPAETLSFVAKATVGTGRENARFMPVTSRCSYGYTLDSDEGRKKEFFNRWLNDVKKITATELQSDTKREEEFKREFNTMEVQRCYKVDEKGEPYSFDFVVESVGVLDPLYVVGRAIEVIQAKLLKYASIDSGDLPPNLRVLPSEARGPLFDFIFQGEDHTLGNLLQTWIDQQMIDSGEVMFVGYKVPHPLRDEMVLRVGVKEGKDIDARAAVAKACRDCAKMFKDWSAMWANSTNGI